MIFLMCSFLQTAMFRRWEVNLFYFIILISLDSFTKGVSLQYVCIDLPPVDPLLYSDIL